MIWKYSIVSFIMLIMEQTHTLIINFPVFNFLLIKSVHPSSSCYTWRHCHKFLYEFFSDILKYFQAFHIKTVGFFSYNWLKKYYSLLSYNWDVRFDYSSSNKETISCSYDLWNSTFFFSNFTNVLLTLYI